MNHKLSFSHEPQAIFHSLFTKHDMTKSLCHTSLLSTNLYIRKCFLSLQLTFTHNFKIYENIKAVDFKVDSTQLPQSSNPFNFEVPFSEHLNRICLLPYHSLYIPYIDMERFAGLHICSFNPIEVFCEIVLRCLGQKCLLISINKERCLSQKKFRDTLENMKTMKV